MVNFSGVTAMPTVAGVTAMPTVAGVTAMPTVAGVTAMPTVALRQCLRWRYGNVYGIPDCFVTENVILDLHVGF